MFSGLLDSNNVLDSPETLLDVSDNSISFDEASLSDADTELRELMVSTALGTTSVRVSAPGRLHSTVTCDCCSLPGGLRGTSMGRMSICSGAFSCKHSASLDKLFPMK